MAGDQIKRFERWRTFLRPNSAYLVQLVLDEVVPEFRIQGFERHPDYASGSTFAAGGNCIPLQRRLGPEWPTVEILFDGRGRPSLGVHFSSLPERCSRATLNGPVEIPRINANVTEGAAFFSLCKGEGKNYDCNFGYQWFSLAPKRRLHQEVDILKSLLPWLFKLFANGIPSVWVTSKAGYVDKNAFLSPASSVFRRE